MTNQPISQGMPRYNTPVVNPDGTMNYQWYRFFLSLYTITGMQFISPGQQANSDYFSPLILYNPTVTGGTPYGSLHVLRQPDGSFLHGGTVVLTAP